MLNDKDFLISIANLHIFFKFLQNICNYFDNFSVGYAQTHKTRRAGAFAPALRLLSNPLVKKRLLNSIIE